MGAEVRGKDRSGAMWQGEVRSSQACSGLVSHGDPSLLLN